jgi:tetratricopeptide (TPR) repeat protein
VDTTRALQLYDGGGFDQAVEELKAAADKARGEDASRARDLAARIAKFAGVFADAKAALAGKRLDRAEEALTAALHADQQINAHYDGEIREMLGSTYRGRAAEAMTLADYVAAARNARQALQYHASDALARQILDKCVAEARKWYDQASGDVHAGRKDAARQRLQKVLDVAPLGEPLGDKATELMQQAR